MSAGGGGGDATEAHGLVAHEFDQFVAKVGLGLRDLEIDFEIGPLFAIGLSVGIGEFGQKSLHLLGRPCSVFGHAEERGEGAIGEDVMARAPPVVDVDAHHAVAVVAFGEGKWDGAAGIVDVVATAHRLGFVDVAEGNVGIVEAEGIDIDGILAAHHKAFAVFVARNLSACGVEVGRHNDGELAEIALFESLVELPEVVLQAFGGTQAGGVVVGAEVG